MANLFGGIGGDSGGYGGGTGGQYGPLAGQTYYADPAAAGGLIQQLIQSLGQQQGNFNQFLQNPAASPEYQQQAAGILASQKPVLQQGATQLADIFRGAGNTSSSVFGQAANQFVADQQRNTQDMLLKALNQIVQQRTAAVLPQILQGPQLLEAMRLSQQYRAPQQQQTTSSGGAGSSQMDALLDALSGDSTQQSTTGGVTTATRPQTADVLWSGYNTPTYPTGATYYSPAGYQNTVPTGQAPYLTGSFNPETAAQGITGGQYQVYNPNAAQTTPTYTNPYSGQTSDVFYPENL